MNIDINNIDIERLRNDLINEFFGIAFTVSQAAFIDVYEVEKASPKKLIEIVINNDFDLNDYVIKTRGL